MFLLFVSTLQNSWGTNWYVHVYVSECEIVPLFHSIFYCRTLIVSVFARGEHGYIRLCRECSKYGKEGECGILREP